MCCFLVVLCACAHRSTEPSRVSPTTAAPIPAPPAALGDETTLPAVARSEGTPEELAPEQTAFASTPESPACALPALSALSSADLIAQRGTKIEPYQLEGGAWLAHAPVLINQDYDFAAALSLGPVGAGLAAGKRLEANRRKADALDAVDLPPELGQCIDNLRAAGVHAFFILWGSESASLRLALDVAPGCEGERRSQLIQGPERPQEEWTTEGTLMLEAARLLAQSREAAAFTRCRGSAGAH